MPARCTKFKKSNSNKNAKPPIVYNKYNDYFFDDTIRVSVPVKVDETGIGFSVFIEMTPISVALDGSKKHETYVNAEHNDSAETKDTQWHFTRSIPPSGPSCFNKDDKIGKVTFDCIIEYKELSPGANIPPNNDNEIDEYEYFGNGEVTFKDYERDLTPDIALLSSGEVVGELKV
ncbi:17586_t:CDS:2 [Gigaspora margarita]|uniref:17586_t:CDS:1 n=1 Tax=Gigaspora margarita TaxID=4874 RepID=A0ABN7VK91_GIGMA|nr:17586_t:CDS:2 [Gigaspora margarita]